MQAMRCRAVGNHAAREHGLPLPLAAGRWRLPIHGAQRLTLGLVPRGQIRLSSLTAVYSPPKPPPRMHTRGPALSLAPAAPKPGAAEQATDRVRRPEMPLPPPLLVPPLIPTWLAAQSGWTARCQCNGDGQARWALAPPPAPPPPVPCPGAPPEPATRLHRARMSTLLAEPPRWAPEAPRAAAPRPPEAATAATRIGSCWWGNANAAGEAAGQVGGRWHAPTVQVTPWP